MFTLHIAGLRTYYGKSLLRKNWHIVREMSQNTDSWVAEQDWIFDGEKQYIF